MERHLTVECHLAVECHIIVEFHLTVECHLAVERHLTVECHLAEECHPRVECHLRMECHFTVEGHLKVECHSTARMSWSSGSLRPAGYLASYLPKDAGGRMCNSVLRWGVPTPQRDISLSTENVRPPCAIMMPLCCAHLQYG